VMWGGERPGYWWCRAKKIDKMTWLSNADPVLLGSVTAYQWALLEWR